MNLFLFIVFFILTIHYRNSGWSLVTGVICAFCLLHSFLKWLEKPDAEREKNTCVSSDMYNESESPCISSGEKPDDYSHSAELSPVLPHIQTNTMCSKQKYDDLSFSDLEYRALNKLKSSKIDDTFSGQLSIEIVRDDFCRLCLSNNLIRYSNAQEDKNLITVNECKDFLRSNSMKVSGKKADLIHRIESFSPEFFGNKHYIITEKGISLLNRHWEENRLNNIKTGQEIHDLKLGKYQISELEFNNFKEQLPFKPFDNDVIWGILNDRLLKYSYSKSYADLRDNYLNMALLLEEESHPERALEYFLMVTCFDINGYASTGKPMLIQWIADRIYFSRKYYDASIAIVAYSQCQIVKVYFTEHMFLSLISNIIYRDNRLSYTDCENLIGEYLKN